jgi:hypothetical protein
MYRESFSISREFVLQSKTSRVTHSPAGQVGTDIPAEKTFLFFSR